MSEKTASITSPEAGAAAAPADVLVYNRTPTKIAGVYKYVDPKTGKVAVKYMCLDQAMSLISINNYLNNGAIRRRFHNDPIAKKAEELLKVENFFE